MNKKAQTVSFEMLMWIPRIVYLILIIIATTGIIYAYIATNVSVGAVESHILLHRLQHSPEGIAEFDAETKRVYPGFVDAAKLSESNLKAALNAENREFAARFVISDLNDENKEVVYFDRQAYGVWAPVAAFVGIQQAQNAETSGSGRKFAHSEARYTYISDSMQLSKLETVVITPDE
ncbi:hypothetical protein HYX10_05545 [Candidatus Woesearchaeota archaeon]|nr:hypothetical protein [Candidatus Woesearchaeota archaeon]